MWTERTGHTSSEGSTATPCDVNDDEDDECRSRTSQDDDNDECRSRTNQDHHDCRCSEERAPYNDDESSAGGNNNEQRCLSPSLRHFDKQQPSLRLGPIWPSVHDCR